MLLLGKGLEFAGGVGLESFLLIFRRIVVVVNILLGQCFQISRSLVIFCKTLDGVGVMILYSRMVQDLLI